jgi:hypothetical protein
LNLHRPLLSATEAELIAMEMDVSFDFAGPLIDLNPAPAKMASPPEASINFRLPTTS